MLILLLFFTFLSGVVTILAPCIWPLLPIILSASASGGHRKPLGIVTGIAVSFTFFTLSLSYILKIIPFDPDNLRLFGVVIIAFLGLVLVIPALGKRMEGLVSRLSSFGGRFLGQSGTGFGSGFITGFALGIVWSPCAGPILATVATLAATQAVNAAVVLVTVAFVAGVAVPLYVFALVGQKLLTKTRALSPYTARIQQVFGVIMILAALAIYTGYDRTLQTKLLDTFPSYGSFLNQFEKNETVKQELENLQNPKQETSLMAEAKKTLRNMQASLENQGPAPEFVGISTWLNTEGNRPLSLASLRGKVVLVDFWTYSCINCIRTLPYVTSWYDKYKDDGFVVVGIHTPEFEFEKKTANVENAIRQYKIHYPVAQDNDFATWRAYRNQYWPAHYLIDAEGNIRERHFGEGNYEETEKAIQSLLKEAGVKDVERTLTQESKEASGRGLTPETYLGSARSERFLSPEPVGIGEQTFSLPASLTRHSFAFDGKWSVGRERVVAGTPAALNLHFNARKVFLVMSPAPGKTTSRMSVFLDGEKIGAESAGKDVQAGMLTLDSERLYELVNLPGDASLEGILRLEFETPGTAAYAFTFGG
ncbi:MAG: cytochrome c biogenesis protein DipZ [Candidatus Moraniibacteriota bacterium]